MSALLLLAFLVSFGTKAAAVSPKPHIVFVLVDDWGFADVGFRNPAIKTPNFDMLARTGLILNRHYVFKCCSPSRVSFLTGRWPHHAHQYNIRPHNMVGANINMTMLPAKLKQAGYATHMVGKWHEGFFQSKYLPVQRGFDSSSGILSGAADHFTDQRDCAVDYWRNMGPSTRNGTYDAYTYRDDLTKLLANHCSDTPLFLYLSLRHVHHPFQAPEEWLNIYAGNTLQAMVSVADNVTGHVVEILKKKNMWDNTLIVVSADNGGDADTGSNHPLKGSKGTFFEGGVRALAFASGGLIPEKMRGQSTDGFIHIADWYPTFCKLANVDPSDSGPGKFPVDGLDAWPIVTGETTITQHEEIVLGFNYSGHGAIIAGEHKLIVNEELGERYDNTMWLSRPKGGSCHPYCLYNIVTDPQEKNELSSSKQDILEYMLERYNHYSKEDRNQQDQGYHTDAEVPEDKNACLYMQEHGGYWQPWKD